MAAHWGCSRANVSKNVAKGMPMDSLAAADAWRLQNSVRGVGYRSKKKAAAPPKQAESLRKDEEGEPESAAGRHKPKLLKTLAASLAASIEVETEALNLVQLGQKSADDASLPLRIAAYNKAKEGRMQSEKLVRAWDLETKTLITFEDAKEMCSRFLGPTIIRLRSISKRAGGMANPADPVYAESVIAREIEGAIKEAQSLYAKETSA
jgi:hypothetical protein